MRSLDKWLAASIGFMIILQFACKDGGTEPILEMPVLLGFEDKFALRMVLAEPYLYVCAGSNGVWRRDIRRMSEWQYLGLRDTSLGRYINVGALDMDVLGEDILVAYNGGAPHVIPESTVSVWRSTNGGTNWFRSDSGIPESITDPQEHNVINSLQRSPHTKQIGLAVYGPATYRSTDIGSSWQFSGVRGVFVNIDHVRWHPFRAGEAWFFGETALFAPYLRAMRDYGLTPKTHANFDSLGFPSDATVNDIAFDAGNPEIVYAATSFGVIITTDGGYTWRRNAVNVPDNGFVFRMAYHPSIASVLYLAGGKRVYASRDGGIRTELIGEVEHGFITSLVLHIQGNQLFVGTTEGGIYALKLTVGE